MLVLLIFVSALLACLLGLGGVLVLWSHPGRPKPFVDERGMPIPDSLSEKIRLRINGVEQGMFIKSRDRTHPVLLYIHGGMPEYFLAQRYNAGLEDQFTVCWWEQRGSGLSYHPGIPRSTLTVEQLVCDTLEVTDYLRRRFEQDQIYLMAHSGGTFPGILAAARAPGRYRAYIGVAQTSAQLRSEKRAYDYILQQLKERGKRRMIRKLEAAPVSPERGVPRAYLSLRDEAMHGLGIGTTHDMRSVFKGIFLPSLQSREYTLAEKINLWRGKVASGVSSMWDEIIATDLAIRVPELDVPVYFLHGVHDYTCSCVEAEAYFEKLKAPIKGFYAFPYSAHSPVFEEPARAQKILREDVLAGTNRLADKR